MSTVVASAAELRQERVYLESDRRTMAAIVEVRALGGRMEARPGNSPLAGIAIEYNGEVSGHPTISNVREAAARLTQIDARLHEIAAAMPEAEQREHEERAEREQRAREQREARFNAAVQACAALAVEAREHEDAYAAARNAVNDIIAVSPLADVFNKQRALHDVAYRFRAALPHDAAERQRLLATLGDDADAARRALSALPGVVHAAALAPVETSREYDWFVNAFLALPTLAQLVSDLNMNIARQEAMHS